MSVCAFDLESHLLQPGLLTPPLVCASFAVGDAATVHPISLIDAPDDITDETTVAGANFVFDSAALMNHQPSWTPEIFRWYEEGRIHDVQIAQALDAIARGCFLKDPETGLPFSKGRYSLARCVSLVLGRDDAKKHDFWRKRYALLESLPIAQWPEEARQYALDDARNTLEVAVKQIDGHKNLSAMKRETRAALILHLGAVWGLRTSETRVANLASEVEFYHQKRVAKFEALGLMKGGKKDLGAIRKAVEEAYAGQPPRTDKGSIRTDRDTLLESGDERLEDFADDTFEKVRTTYIPFLRQGTVWPLNLRPNVLVGSFRTSYDGPIQQMPRGGAVRSCFAARPGYVYASVDYAQLEMATLAQTHIWMFGDSSLAKAINDGQDLHSLFAANMLGISYEDLVARLHDPKVVNYRQAAKAANFGFPGGMGPQKLVEAKRREGVRFCRLLKGQEKCGRKVGTEGGVCEDCMVLAMDLRREWFKQWPEMYQYFKRVDRVVTKKGYIEIPTPDGPVIRGGVGFCDGANGYFQGLAALGAKNALWLVGRECWVDRGTALYGSRPIAFIHDEVLSEMPEEVSHEASIRKCDLMVKGMAEYVPDVAIRVSWALSRYWDKRAKGIERDGRRVVWEGPASE